MNFYVNGNKLDITLENEKTVGDVLKGFEEEAEPLYHSYTRREEMKEKHEDDINSTSQLDIPSFLKKRGF